MPKWRKPHGREHRWNRAALIRRDGLACALCGLPMASMAEVTVDHVIPLSLGGTDKVENLRLVHERCNNARGVSLREWGACDQTP